MIVCRQSTEYDFEVWHISSTGYKYHVNLLRNECDCRKWLLTGLPCCHAISCMRKRSLNIYDFVPDCYRKAKYEACYSSVIYPANGQCLWKRTEYNDLQPPPIRRQAGRPKKKRNKEAGELLKSNGQLSRGRWGIKCTRCKQPGHNKATCKLPPPPTQNAARTGQAAPSTQTASMTTEDVQGKQTASWTGKAAQSTQNVSRTAQATQSTHTTSRNTPAGQGTQSASRTIQTATRTSAGTQRASATQRTTHGAQLGTESANKRKRNQKEKMSSSQPEGSKGKKKKTSARVEGSVSTQH